MIGIFKGKATIDEQMYLRKVDDDFSRLIKIDMYAPITQCIHEQDVHRLIDAVEELKNSDMKQDVVVLRIKKSDGEYCWVTVRLSYASFKIDGKAVISLDINELDNHSMLNNIRDINEEYSVYLDLMDGIVLEYSEETRILNVIFKISGQDMNLFCGSVEEWKKVMLNGNVSEDFAAEFENMCADIEQFKKEFKYDIQTSFFSKAQEMDICTFKFRTIKNRCGNSRVLGVVARYGKNRDKEVLFNMQYARDTGLDVLNKKSITEYAKKVILGGYDKKVFLCIFDLDDFKTINDTCGHMFGDEVLNTVAEIIKDAVGNRGMVGRIGGDELFIVIDKVEEHTELRNMLRTIRTNVEWAYKGKRDDVNITCSIGVATYPDNGDTYEKVFQLADKMLYRAKEKGKNRYVIYIPEIHDEEYVMAAANAASSQKAEYTKLGKTELMMKVIDSFLTKKIITYENLLNDVGYSLNLDTVMLIYEDMNIITTWNKDGRDKCDVERSRMASEKDFFDNFDSNNMYVLNGVYNLEGKYPEVLAMLNELKIESAIFYKFIKHGQMYGYALFARKTRRQKWSDYEITMLGVVGKALEISFSDR